MYQRIPLTPVDRWTASVVTLWFLMFGVLSAFVTHAFTFFPDSRQHYQYISVLRSGHLPRLTAEKIHQEEHQPPLYYLSAVPFQAIGELQSTETGVLMVRLWTLLVGSVVVWIGVFLARQLAPNSRYVPGLTALIIGLNPQFIVMSAEVNNDAFASVLGALCITSFLGLVLGWEPGSRGRWWLGIALAAAFLTKMSLWPMVISVIVLYIFRNYRHVRACFQVAIPTFVVAGWWLGRNTVLYGDPLVAQKFREFWGYEQYQAFLSPHGIWVWLTLLFETYWARFRHFTSGMHYQTYAALKLVTVGSMVGIFVFLVTAWRRFSRKLQWAYVALLGYIAIVIGGVFVYSLHFYQPQGRYLFPVNVGIAFCLALGLDSLVPKRWKLWMATSIAVGLVLLNMAAFRVVVYSG